MPRRTSPTGGRVELTWPGKAELPATVAAGPLTLRERDGEASGWCDRLIWGDNSPALAALHEELGAAVDLVYIDPPFDVGASHYLRKGEVEVLAYRDSWGGPGYLSMLYPRLSLLRALMKPTATIVVHVGIQVCHHVRVAMDEVFGADNFVNQIAWKRYSAHNDAGQGARRLGGVHDVLLLYGMGPERTWTTQRAPYDKDYVAKWYRHVEPGTGRRFMSSPLTAPGGAAKGNPSYEFLGVRRFWRYGQATMETLHRSGRVYQSRPGAVPRQKQYLDEQEGVPLQDVWTDIRALQGTHTERVGYDTQKPEALLERIVQMCSRPGDLILDAFAGSGTTAAVAARHGRRWIVIDRSQPAFAVIRRRLRAQCRRGEAGPFAVHDALPAARRALIERVGEAELRGRLLALHGAKTWPEGQVMDGAAGAPEAGAEARPAGHLPGRSGVSRSEAPAAERDGPVICPEGQAPSGPRGTICSEIKMEEDRCPERQAARAGGCLTGTCPDGHVSEREAAAAPLHGRRGGAAVVVAVGEQRPTAFDIEAWLAAARAAGASALELIAWDFDAPAHELAGEAVSLWEIPRPFADGEAVAPVRAARLVLAIETTTTGRAVRLVDYAAADDAGGATPTGLDALVEWAIDDACEGEVFAPRWSTQRERDGTMTSLSPEFPEGRPLWLEVVDVTGRITSRTIA
ncbi:site-specific DNA-methyltransferase [Nannocystis bainbridge]|uniref:site-specific DNA-methyltransferase (adenine-specific) n=1 Tax=Nannocystis bainbridge TaxID=2995303 RepID=A0ABT5DTJ4_9BACT|nr:site-specific DNA-methyltransferase [Nannocystis bainbridge]MDC0716856.1 site-specific DNA-methyltransferase [Nannocystis bainbridge]